MFIIGFHQILDLDLAAGDTILVFDGATSVATQLATMAENDVVAASLMTAGDQRMLMSTQNTMLVEFTSYHPSNARGFLFAYQAGDYYETSYYIVFNMDFSLAFFGGWGVGGGAWDLILFQYTCSTR